MLPLETFIVEMGETGEFVIMTNEGALIYYDLPYWGA